MVQGVIQSTGPRGSMHGLEHQRTLPSHASEKTSDMLLLHGTPLPRLPVLQFCMTTLSVFPLYPIQVSGTWVHAMPIATVSPRPAASPILTADVHPSWPIACLWNSSTISFAFCGETASRCGHACLCVESGAPSPSRGSTPTLPYVAAGNCFASRVCFEKRQAPSFPSAPGACL